MFNFFIQQILGNSPKINSIAEYLNILGKFDEKTLLTKDENLVRGFKIKGLSYIAMGTQKEAGLHSDRFAFINKIDENLECLVFLKREKSTLNSDNELRSDNPYANKIIDIWEKDFRLADINYYFLVSTKKENMVEKVDKKIDKKQQHGNFDFKTNKLDTFSENLKQFLREYSVEELNADELVSFYASILNGEDMKIDCDKYLFDDYFVGADIEFKKNYLIRTLPTKEIYSSIVSITTYDGNFIYRKDLTNILQVDSNLMIGVGFLQLNKRKARNAISNATMKTKDGSVHDELEKVRVAVDEDKLKLFDVSINILISEDSLEKMEQTIANIVAICKKNHLLTKRESLAQKSIFLSFFPSLWEKCNMRKRVQTAGVLTNYLSFENDLTGVNFNPWGNKAVAVLRNSIQRPYLFNFHLPTEEGESNQMPAGHTLVIGGTGSGKTTLVEFLIAGLFKYENLNIFALDKHHGMSVFTHFIDGEYHDVGNDFKLNPFSLDNNNVNKNFLQVFLETLAGLRGKNADIDLDSTEEKKNLIRDSLNRVFEYVEKPEEKTFSSFLLSLESDRALQTRFEKWRGSILDNCDDALDFSKKLAVLNMDAILKDQDLTSIVAYYIFHKLINKSVADNKGFFIFIDELREYLGNSEMAHQIITLILEARKLNGVLCMGVQNVDFFEEMVGEKLANSFLSNIAHFVIYPTSDMKNLENLQKRIGLTSEEVDFLKTTSLTERKALIKQGVANSQQIKASVVVDLNLKSLKEYIKFFSSSSKDVAKMKELRLSYQEQWRDKFLSG